MITFLFASTQTTSCLITNLIIFLNSHPEWKQKVRSEIEEVIIQPYREEHNGDLDLSDAFTTEKVYQLKNLGLVVNETMRKEPPIHLSQTYQVTKDT